MWYQGLFAALEELRDPTRAIGMEKYMRMQFPFLGVPAAPRKKSYRSFIQTAVKKEMIDFDFVFLCYQKDEREFQYAAADYLFAVRDLLTPEDLPTIKKYVVSKSWWDTVDILDGVVGRIVQNHPEAKRIMFVWSKDENFWVRRLAIDHQLLFKKATDRELLGTIIENNFGSKEFFINKAIGWSLRDYSKTNPDWVREFIERHRDKMAPLSIREGSKYI